MQQKIEIMFILYCYAFINGFFGAKEPVKERLVSAVMLMSSFVFLRLFSLYRHKRVSRPSSQNQSQYSSHIISRLNRISRDAHILQVGMVREDYRPDNTLKLIWERACLEVALSQMPFSSHQSVLIYREWIEILVRSEGILQSKFKYYLPRNRRDIKNSLGEKISLYARQSYHVVEKDKAIVISKAFAERCQRVIGKGDPAIEAMSFRITKESLDFWKNVHTELHEEQKGFTDAMSSYDAA